MDFKTYFQSYQDYFWEWEDQAQYLVIPNGHTIAYRDFAVQLIEDLAEQGVPSFGTLLLSIIATNTSGIEDLDSIQSLFEKKFLEQNDNDYAMGNLMLQNSMPFLNRLANLPEEYKTGDYRRQIFFAIFLDAHNRLSAKKTTALLINFKENKASFHLNVGQPKPFYDQLFYRDFRIFELLNKKYPTEEALIEAIKSIPIVDEKELEQILEQDSTEFDSDVFVQELKDDPKTFHVGALLKRLWSGLNIPFQNLMPSDQPLGGISDLTNKGTFDKLLISEFAYDDLSFLSRLANNEALYLHREAPPDANHLERVILIDQSLKNWGRPKTLSFAVMLAIVHHPKAVSDCQVYALGDSYQAIRFNHKEDIINSFANVSDALDCSNGLQAFYEDKAVEKTTEAIFISTEDATRNTSIQKMLHQYQQHFKYWIYVTNDGCITLYKNQNKGKKFVQTIQLPLQELWKKTQQPKQKEDRPIETGNHPILFPRTLSPKRFLVTSDQEHFVITAEKNLMRFYDPKFNRNSKGWDLLYEKLPVTSGTYEVGLSSNGDYLFLAFNVQNRALHLVNLTTGKERSFFFTSWKSSRFEHFLFHEDKFYYLKNSGYFILDFSGEEEIIIDKHPPDLIKAYEDRMIELEELNNRFWYAPGVLKNINSITLSVEGHLVLNKLHRLILNPYGVIKFEQIIKCIEKNRASYGDHRNEFKFQDGSCIRLNRSGILTFISSNQSIPIFYIPTVVDSALGIGTESQFAGNDYYNPSDKGALQVISTLNFWEAIVKSFIETIQNYEA